MIHETLKRYKLTNEELLTKLGLTGKMHFIHGNVNGDIIIECLEDGTGNVSTEVI